MGLKAKVAMATALFLMVASDYILLVADYCAGAAS